MNYVVKRVFDGERFEVSFMDGSFIFRHPEEGARVLEWSPHGRIHVSKIFICVVCEDSILCRFCDSGEFPVIEIPWQNIEFKTEGLKALCEVDK